MADFTREQLDGNGLNNRITNLRSCSASQNMWNRKKNKNNTSGYKGISWDKKNQKYLVALQCYRKVKTIGRFESIEKAKIAYENAVNKYHGEFGRAAS